MRSTCVGVRELEDAKLGHRRLGRLDVEVDEEEVRRRVERVQQPLHHQVRVRPRAHADEVHDAHVARSRSSARSAHSRRVRHQRRRLADRRAPSARRRRAAGRSSSAFEATSSGSADCPSARTAAGSAAPRPTRRCPATARRRRPPSPAAPRPPRRASWWRRRRRPSSPAARRPSAPARASAGLLLRTIHLGPRERLNLRALLRRRQRLHARVVGVDAAHREQADERGEGDEAHETHERHGRGGPWQERRRLRSRGRASPVAPHAARKHGAAPPKRRRRRGARSPRCAREAPAQTRATMQRRPIDAVARASRQSTRGAPRQLQTAAAGGAGGRGARGRAGGRGCRWRWRRRICSSRPRI